MEFLTDHWGDLLSAVGVVVSVSGLAWAVIEARGARAAAQAAERMAERTRREAIDNIQRHLLVVDIERAVDLIQRLKLLHSIGRWEAALEQYQALRLMTSSIISRYPEQYTRPRERLSSARALIRAMEDYVESRGAQGLDSEDSSRLNQQLNVIQSDLEDIGTTTGVGGQ